jgi:DNA-binding NarL/FixJ family response regulator
VAEALVVADALAQDADLPTVAASPPPLPPNPRPSDPFGLSPREREVLTLIARRLTDPEIAAALFISPRTVHRHASNLFDKLGVNSRREAAAVAVRHGFV